MPGTRLHNGTMRTKQTLATGGSYDIREAAVGDRLVMSICRGSREVGEMGSKRAEQGLAHSLPGHHQVVGDQRAA